MPTTWGQNRALLVAVGLLVRLVVIWIGSIQDAREAVPFTDIDYLVFSDAGKHVAEGGSPYERHTFRYSPVMAYLALPNVWVHGVVGKILFSLCDACIGWLMADKLRTRGLLMSLWLPCLWLFNPFVIGISTRGSADSLTALIVLLSLTRRLSPPAAALFGFAVHLRLYPVIYAPPVAAYLLTGPDGSAQAMGKRIRDLAVNAAVAGGAFVGLFLVFYARYGFEFLENTYLYHFSRVDHRHNFSPFFPLMSQMALSEAEGRPITKILSIAQWGSACAVGLAFALPSALTAGRRPAAFEYGLLLQTIIFVAFNRVITAQYFMWWFVFLPSSIASLSLQCRGKLALVIALAAWVAAECLWLTQGYAIEFVGRPAFLGAEICGWLFFGAHMALAGTLVLLW